MSDSKLREDTLAHIQLCARAGPGTLLLETAGGVNSPTPSGILQGDLYQPLRLPVCLVADHSLGGISATVSAFESLHVRGYTVDAILQFENPVYQNHNFLQDYFRARGIESLVLPCPPLRLPDIREEFQSISDYYSRMSSLDCVKEFLNLLSNKQKLRIEKLENMSTDAQSKIWYPFTQHKHVSPDTIMSIDSASGDFFQTVQLKRNTNLSPDASDAILSPTFDGSASWWTQGVGHASPTLALAAAHAAGRYGHVLFAGSIHQPALDLAETLLKNLKNPRMSKVFFSDNGSTGVEVAIKMALSATSQRYSYSQPFTKELGVIGLKGSYHGDTIGAMDCSEPGIFNKKVAWYKGRGYWFDFPHVTMRNGLWQITLPEVIDNFRKQTPYDKTFQHKDTRHKIEDAKSDSQEPFEHFPSLGKIFDLNERKKSNTASLYEKYISETLKRLTQDEGHKFGALIIEPVLLGAGGMHFIDPLFEHILVEVVRKSTHLFCLRKTHNIQDQNAWTGLPVIFDEVFTGLYRLGRFSAASFLQAHPDISVHAKLLTGGLLPLCCTLASQNIYESFISDSKTEALLHGHSYTAHPIGCHVANNSLKLLMDFDANETWREGKIDWWRREEWANTSERRDSGGLVENDIWKLANQRSQINEPSIWSVWSYDFIRDISHTKETSGVLAIGSVLAITLKDENRGMVSNYG